MLRSKTLGRTQSPAGSGSLPSSSTALTSAARAAWRSTTVGSATVNQLISVAATAAAAAVAVSESVAAAAAAVVGAVVAAAADGTLVVLVALTK
jgi:hypothetical protein